MLALFLLIHLYYIYNLVKNMNQSLATFGGGCFWCTEAIFLAVKGVDSVESGYIDGNTENPDYIQVCSGNTGYAEAIQITFDPQIISYETLLLIFFKTHDPTTLNRQGNDIGTQYRSAVFYHSAEQKEVAEKMISLLEEQLVYSQPILTEIKPATKFYPAEEYHQNYYYDNLSKPYCMFVIQPKLAKFAAEFQNFIKSDLKR